MGPTLCLRHRLSISAFLLVWFFIWGICPWDTSSAAAQTVEAAHTQHGHQPVDDTHHTSKGIEHSCSGSISYSQEKLIQGKGCLKLAETKNFPALIVLPSHFYQPHHLSLPFSQTTRLPKRFSDLYQFNPTLRI
ncbi:MAG: hypothetical protein WBK96_09975 [Candidatus Manganitrophaceae bacterium]